MKRLTPLLWPLLVGTLSLSITAWLWSHERQTQDRHLRDNFDFGLRQTAIRIEQRMASYEQMLRGARGLFEASDEVTRPDFSTYVDTLLAGSDFAGMRTMAYAPLLSEDRLDTHEAAQRAQGVRDYAVRPRETGRTLYAPVTYLAPESNINKPALGYDPFSDPVRRAAMLQARDSGGVAMTDRVRPTVSPGSDPESAFLMFMPLYAKGLPLDTTAQRQNHLIGWVFAMFRIEDLMSSLYGEGTPGLDVFIYDGVGVHDDKRMFPTSLYGEPPPARFEALEYIGHAGHTWTLRVRSRPEFDARYGHDSPQVIAIAGSVLSLLLALMSWLLVTGRERAHDAARSMTSQLRDSAERYRRIVETADEGIWTLDAEGRTTFVNPKMQQMLGFSAGEMLGRPWGDFTDHRPLPPDAAQPAGPRDICFRRKNGTPLWGTLSTSPIADAKGQHAGVLAMVTDISERKLADDQRAALEVQLRQSQKMEAIGTLAGGIAHDFNNILAAILGNVALMQQDLGDKHPASARLEQVGRAATRARSLVQQISAFSRQQPQQLVNQPLRPVLEETVKLLRSMLPALVELDVRLSDTPLQVGADATQMQQVLMNLCTNAWHALQGRAGRIVIGLDEVNLSAEAAARLGGLRAGPHAHLWVSDNGCGMDDATRLRVFEPFFTTKPVGQGTGLGLAVVHGIVSSHHGAITVESAPGRGSRFDMHFPLVQAGATVEPAAPAALPKAPAGHGQHVLYVDDDPVMVTMVDGLLQRAGYRVTTTADPREALALLQQPDDPFDLVVSDFNMPELSGLDLAHALTRLHPGLPIIITSGYVSDALRADAHRAGVSHVIQKEYTLEQLCEAIHHALMQEGAVSEVGRG